jgi:hypothetical protein
MGLKGRSTLASRIPKPAMRDGHQRESERVREREREREQRGRRGHVVGKRRPARRTGSRARCRGGRRGTQSSREPAACGHGKGAAMGEQQHGSSGWPESRRGPGEGMRTERVSGSRRDWANCGTHHGREHDVQGASTAGKQGSSAGRYARLGASAGEQDF